MSSLCKSAKSETQALLALKRPQRLVQPFVKRLQLKPKRPTSQLDFLDVLLCLRRLQALQQQKQATATTDEKFVSLISSCCYHVRELIE